MASQPLLSSTGSGASLHTDGGYGSVPGGGQHHEYKGDLYKCSTYIEKSGPDNKARNKLILAATICLFFTCAEALGGYLSNSLAIFTDASHMTIDFVSYSISLVALWIAKQPSTRRATFGWHRAEVLGALFSVFTIWAVTGVLLYLAIVRLIDQDYQLEPNPMLITAVLGVVVNLVMGCVLMPEEVWRRDRSQKNNVNINVRAAFIHVLGDLVQSFGVLIGAIIIKFKPQWKLADPICTFFFALLVLITTMNILKDTLTVLLEGMPDDIDKEEIEFSLCRLDGVVGVHSLNIWALTMDKNAISVHLLVDDRKPGFRLGKVLQTAKMNIQSISPFYHMTIQIEPLDSPDLLGNDDIVPLPNTGLPAVV